MGDKIFDYGSMSLLLLLLFCFKVGSVWRVVADLHATSDHERERERRDCQRENSSSPPKDCWGQFCPHPNNCRII